MIAPYASLSEFTAAITDVQRNLKSLRGSHATPNLELHFLDFRSGVERRHTGILAK